MSKPRLLVVDDEPDLRWVLRSLFEDAGFEVTEAGDGETAIAAVRQRLPDVVLSDVRMPKVQGLDLVRVLHEDLPELPVVLLSAVEDIATAVDAIKAGAFDYQAKPFEPERLLLTIRRAAEQHQLRCEVARLRDAATDFGVSEAAQQLRHKLQLVAGQPTLSVLLVGESGTGKEVAAREIHRCSPVAAGPFVAIDCGALPEPLMESQLFGHKRGAFTGADRDRQGLFELANGGTLFLDELGNLPIALQAKLLRALQERAVTPVGDSRVVPFQARLICATNSSLEADVKAGRFRVDLYHRIAEFTLRLPPLRQRPEDIVHFARRFVIEASRELGRHVTGLRPAAAAALQQQDWPGNFRELRNVIRRAVLMCTERELDAVDLELKATERAAGPTVAADAKATHGPLADRIRNATDALEAEILAQTLAKVAGNKAAAARLLQIDYTTLHRKLKRYGLLGER